MTPNRADTDQLEELLWYMEHHLEFARGHVTDLGRSGHEKYKQMWSELSKRLNNMGSTRKNVAGWMKTWRLLKNGAKTKKAAYTVAMNKTGNVAPIQPLRDFDLRITGIFGKYGTGLSVVAEAGVPSKPRDAIESCEISDEEIESRKVINEHDVLHEAHQEDTVKCIASHTVGLQRSLNSLEHPNKKNNAILEAIFNNFGNHLVKFIIELERLKKLRDGKISRSRSNNDQMKLLVRFMKQNRSLARGEVEDAQLCDQLWTGFAERLNSAGGIKKDVKGWIKTWNALVKSVQQRRKKLMKGQRNTPVPPDDLIVLEIMDDGGDSENDSQESKADGAGHSYRSPDERDRSPLPRTLASPKALTNSVSATSHSRRYSPGRFRCHTPVQSSHRSSDKSLARFSRYYSQKSPGHSPRYSSRQSPGRSPRYSSRQSPGRSPRYSSRRSLTRSRHSSRRSPTPSRHSSCRSPTPSRHSSRHSLTRSPRYSSRQSPLSSSLTSYGNSSVRLDSGNGSSQAQPKPWPVVDLTSNKTSPAVPSQQTQSKATKGSNSTVAVITAMDEYSKILSKFAADSSKYFADHNRILEQGFKDLGARIDNAVNQIFSNRLEEMARASDDEANWPAVYLDEKCLKKSDNEPDSE